MDTELEQVGGCESVLAWLFVVRHRFCGGVDVYCGGVVCGISVTARNPVNLFCFEVAFVFAVLRLLLRLLLLLCSFSL